MQGMQICSRWFRENWNEAWAIYDAENEISQTHSRTAETHWHDDAR